MCTVVCRADQHALFHVCNVEGTLHQTRIVLPVDSILTGPGPLPKLHLAYGWFSVHKFRHFGPDA